jgi:hypothetical protein
MAFAIFNLGAAPFNPARGLRRRDEKIEETIMQVGSARQTARVEIVGIPFRVYTWPVVQMTDAQRSSLVAFFEANGITRGAFLVRDHEDPKTLEVTLEPAVGDGLLTTFSLPTDDSLEAYRYFAKPGTIVGLVNGAAVTVASADQDARTITFAVAPPAAQSVQARFTPLRLVKPAKPWDRTEIDVGEHSASFDFEEVWRD